ncbi:hypothetical protein KI688_007867 [Linnemannia hyalina]|uniref:Uncharacterized protein n=1 Tax=Linnemannia hyalina TaxID=64524 RepID=A0A9P8BM86_9FUNG|nr:hypothetical protein KI688_007867 [Linnemannia hyalina]
MFQQTNTAPSTTLLDILCPGYSYKDLVESTKEGTDQVPDKPEGLEELGNSLDKKNEALFGMGVHVRRFIEQVQDFLPNFTEGRTREEYSASSFLRSAALQLFVELKKHYRNGPIDLRNKREQEVEGRLDSFYGNVVLKKHKWNARETRAEEYRLIADHLVHIVGGSTGAKGDEDNKVVIGVGLGKFSSKTGLSSLHESFQSYLVQKEFVGQVDLRRLYCLKCQKYMHRDIMAGHNMCNAIRGHLLEQQRPLYLQPQGSDENYPWMQDKHSSRPRPGGYAKVSWRFRSPILVLFCGPILSRSDQNISEVYPSLTQKLVEETRNRLTLQGYEHREVQEDLRSTFEEHQHNLAQNYVDPTTDLEHYRVLNQELTWVVESVDLMEHFRAFRPQHLHDFSLARDGIADMRPGSKIETRSLEVLITGVQERKNHDKDPLIEAKQVGQYADGVTFCGSSQLYLSEASTIHNPKADKCVRDEFKLARAMRDSWINQFDAFLVPLKKQEFGIKVKAAVTRCLELALRVGEEIEARLEDVSVIDYEKRIKLEDAASAIESTTASPSKGRTKRHRSESI